MTLEARPTLYQRSRLYTNRCVQLAKPLRGALRVEDGDRITVWVRVRRGERLLGQTLLEDAALTSGGELYIGSAVDGAREGDEVEIILPPTSEDRERPSNYDTAWSSEIHTRVDRVLSGKSKGKPWEQVRSEVRAALNDRPRRRTI